MSIRERGFLTGITCALAGMAIFSVIEAIRMGMRGGDFIVSLFIVGCFFAVLPAGIGGVVLGARLQSQMRRGILTPARGAWTGVLLAGLAAIVICGVGIIFLLVTPRNGWQYLLEEIAQGNFFANIPIYVQDVGRLAKNLGPEILMAVTIACIAGGWGGWVLAKQLNQEQSS